MINCLGKQSLLQAMIFLSKEIATSIDTLIFTRFLNRGHQFFRSQWEGPQIDAWARRVKFPTKSLFGYPLLPQDFGQVKSVKS